MVVVVIDIDIVIAVFVFVMLSHLVDATLVGPRHEY